MRFLHAAEETFAALAAMLLMGRAEDFDEPRLVGMRRWRVRDFENYLIFYRPLEDGFRHFAEKITRNSYKVVEIDRQALQDKGCSDEEVFETVAVTSLFNSMDRMADALGAPVEGLQEMMAHRLQN